MLRRVPLAHLKRGRKSGLTQDMLGEKNRLRLTGRVVEGLSGAFWKVQPASPVRGCAEGLGGLLSGIRLYGQCHFQLGVPLTKGCSQLRNCLTPLAPWVVMDGCVSLLIPETGRSDGSILLGDCFFSPQGCDVVSGWAVGPPRSHRGGGQIWKTGGARELLGTPSRSALEEVGAERKVRASAH